MKKKIKEEAQPVELKKVSGIYRPLCIFSAVMFLVMSYSYYLKSDALQKANDALTNYKYTLSFKLQPSEFDGLVGMGINQQTVIHNISVDTVHKLILIKYAN